MKAKDFYIENGTLKKYVGKKVNVVIPDGVKKISSSAFVDMKESYFGHIVMQRIESVTIPSSVLEIEKCAFKGCNELKTVEIKEGLENIGERAFYLCRKLDKIVIPKSVKKIGKSAFYGCTKLFKSVNVFVTKKNFESVFVDQHMPETVRSTQSIFTKYRDFFIIKNAFSVLSLTSGVIGEDFRVFDGQVETFTSGTQDKNREYIVQCVVLGYEYGSYAELLNEEDEAMQDKKRNFKPNLDEVQMIDPFLPV